MTRARKITWGIAGGIAGYVLSFYILMVPNLPAYDAAHRPVFGNCPRFSESVRVPPVALHVGMSAHTSVRAVRAVRARVRAMSGHSSVGFARNG